MMLILTIAICLLVYLAIGVVWAFFRWTAFHRSELRHYYAVRRQFMLHHNISGDEIPEFLRFEWKRLIEATPRLRGIPPDPQDHQDRIALNLALWPLSMGSALWGRVYQLTFHRLIATYTQSLQTGLETVRKDQS